MHGEFYEKRQSSESFANSPLPCHISPSTSLGGRSILSHELIAFTPSRYNVYHIKKGEYGIYPN